MRLGIFIAVLGGISIVIERNLVGVLLVIIGIYMSITSNRDICNKLIREISK